MTSPFAALQEGQGLMTCFRRMRKASPYPRRVEHSPMGRIELSPKMNQFHLFLLENEDSGLYSILMSLSSTVEKNMPCHPGDRVICQMWMFDHSSIISCSVLRIYTRYLHSGSKTSISMHYLFSQACTSATHGQFS